MSVVNKLEQGRAKFAYDCAVKGKEIGKEYKSNVKKLPMLIKTNGLGSAVAFFFSKGKPEHRLIYNQIHEWLKKNEIYKQLQEKIKNEDDKFDPENLIDTIIRLNSPDYRYVTNEVMSFLNWLKRFAEGLIEKEDKND